MLVALNAQIWLMLGAACGGLVVGALYSLCRLLRLGRFVAMADAIFVLLATLWLWLWLFSLCRLDLRFYHLIGLAVGFTIWHYGPDHLLQKLFRAVWRLRPKKAPKTDARPSRRKKPAADSPLP